MLEFSYLTSMKEHKMDVPTRKGCAGACRSLKRPEASDLPRLEGGSENLTSKGHSRQRKPCVWKPAVWRANEAGDWQDSGELGEGRSGR